MKSVTTIAVVVALIGACGGSVEAPAATDPSPVPTGTSTPPPKPPRDPAGDGCGAQCGHVPSGAELDGEIGWKPAVPSSIACTGADFAQLEANIKSTSTQSYFNLGLSLSDGCRGCLISKDTDATWGLFVGSADDNGMTGFTNFGACFGAVDGNACGKAVQYQSYCENAVCNECTTTAAERQSCVEYADECERTCKPFVRAVTAECTDLQNTKRKCATFMDAARTLCGPSPADAGAD